MRPSDLPADITTPYRTIWISDIHLGTAGCKAEYLLHFLRDHESETLYLVGDIVDAWRLKKAWYWPQAHNDVVQKLLRKARKGTRVVFVPGNHDVDWSAELGRTLPISQLLERPGGPDQYDRP